MTRPSWEAFDAGDWDEAMHLLEERREDLKHYHEPNTEAGTETRRIRIVSLPVTPYLQWELHLLNSGTRPAAQSVSCRPER